MNDTFITIEFAEILFFFPVQSCASRVHKCIAIV